jgi:hypothetical protein
MQSHKHVEFKTFDSSMVLILFLDAEPRCGVTASAGRHAFVAEGVILFECEVTYGGSWAPTARWQHLGANGEILSERASTNVASADNAVGKRIRFTLSVNADEFLNKAIFRCIVNFSISQKPVATKADNVPPYNFTWTSDDVCLTHESYCSHTAGERAF